jgi:hypothetical protein
VLYTAAAASCCSGVYSRPSGRSPSYSLVVVVVVSVCVCDFLNIKRAQENKIKIEKRRRRRRKRRKIRAIMEGKTVASVALSFFLSFSFNIFILRGGKKKSLRHFE